MFRGYDTTRNRIIATIVCLAIAACILLNDSQMSTTMTSSEPTVKADRSHFKEKYISVAKTRKFPHAIIIGVRKAGTKALIEFLNMHPDIVVSRDEAHFFDTNTNYENGLNFYRKQMPLSRPDQIVIEKTPRYFFTPYVPERVMLMNASIKLILTVREPVKRMVSAYWMDVRRGDTKKTFKELALHDNGTVNTEFNATDNSMYYKHMTSWLKLFPSDQMHVVNGDNLIADPYEEIHKVEQFLGVGHKITRDHFVFDQKKKYYCMRTKKSDHSCLSKGKGHEHPPIAPEVAEILTEYFKPLNELFYNQNNQHFDW